MAKKFSELRAKMPPKAKAASKEKFQTLNDTMRKSYKRSDFPCDLVRGKYAAQAAASSNIVVLEPEIAAAFPNSAAVDDALRTLLNGAEQVTGRTENQT